MRGSAAGRLGWRAIEREAGPAGRHMKIIDNVSELLGDDLKAEITPGSKVRIAASTFSIFAFEALRKELEQVERAGVHLHLALVRDDRGHGQAPQGTPRVLHPLGEAGPSRACMARSSRSVCGTSSLSERSRGSARTGCAAR